MTLTLRPYQEVGRDFLAAHSRALLADQMRVGKTPQAILAADKVGAKRVLVICPAIATHQWRAEWARWSPLRPLATILGQEPLPPDFTGVAIASYNRATKHVDSLKTKPRWDVVIVDEAHFAKSPYAQRTRAVYARGGIGWNTHRIWALTGTPAPNHAGELWPLLIAFGAVKRSYVEFVRYFCYYNEDEGRVTGNKKQHLAELRALLEPFTLRRTRHDVMPEMPPISYNFLAVEPTPNVDLHSEDLNAIDIEDRIAVAKAKAPLLVEEICTNLGHAYSQTVVFGYHLEPLRLVWRALTAEGIDASQITGETPDKQRQQIQQAFKAGVCQVLIAQILAAGIAIDLSAASHAYMLELDFVPGNNEQAANRLVNFQTQEAVTIDVVNWPGTTDDRVQRALLRKVRGAVFTSG